MSMNLYVRDETNNQTFPLWQTPTYVTRMCLWPNGSPAKDVAERYLFWVASQTNGTWPSKQALEDFEERVRSHTADLRGWLAAHPAATFYEL